MNLIEQQATAIVKEYMERSKRSPQLAAAWLQRALEKAGDEVIQFIHDNVELEQRRRELN